MATYRKKNTLISRAISSDYLDEQRKKANLLGTQGGTRPYSPRYKMKKWGPSDRGYNISSTGVVTDLSKRDEKIIKKLSKKERNTLYKALGVTDVKQKRAKSLKKQQLGSSMKRGGKVKKKYARGGKVKRKAKY